MGALALVGGVPLTGMASEPNACADRPANTRRSNVLLAMVSVAQFSSHKFSSWALRGNISTRLLCTLQIIPIDTADTCAYTDKLQFLLVLCIPERVNVVVRGVTFHLKNCGDGGVQIISRPLLDGEPRGLSMTESCISFADG